MLRDPNSKFWAMWDDRAWGMRAHGTPGCWAHRGGAAFFADAYEGGACNINWLDGYQQGFEDGDQSPALMGHDPQILEFCLSKLGRSRRVWFAHNEELAEQCRAAHENVLRLQRSKWDICINFVFVTCAATGRLPGQGSKQINFATPPGSLKMQDFVDDTHGYSMGDVTFFEYCILSEICANSDDLFRVQPDEPFFCQHSRERYDVFRDLMMSLDG